MYTNSGILRCLPMCIATIYARITKEVFSMCTNNMCFQRLCPRLSTIDILVGISMCTDSICL